jgi:DNA mismatch repair protein MutS2
MHAVSATLPEKTRAHLEWARVLERLAFHCRGPIAAGRARELEPAADREEVATRLRRVTEARRLLDLGHSPPLGGLPDVAAAVGAAARGAVLDPEDLAFIGELLETSARARHWFSVRAESAPALAEVALNLDGGLVDLSDLARELRGSFDEKGQVVDAASGDLGFLRTRVAHLHEELKQRVHGLLSDPEYADLLQDNYYTQRDDRYVLPIKAGQKGGVPGIVHGWSGSGATVYIEPQVVVDANNRLRLAQAEVEREIHRILRRFSERVGARAREIAASQELLAILDLGFAAARLSKELDATEPAFADDGRVALRRARHPLLILGGVDVVPNDIELVPPQRILVVTGPNTGGKTVTLKTVGLCTAMALAGLHIPADRGSIVPRTSAIFSDLGDEQDLERHLSTFSGHIVNLMAILDAIQPGSLVLLDEIVIGTDPIQGAALAQALLERFADREVIALVTTHYESLKALPFSDARFRNGAVGFDADRLLPTYELHMDVPGASSPLQTARRLGLDPAIIDRAAELAGPVQRSLEAVLQTLEAEAERVRVERAALTAEREKAAASRQAAEELERRLRERLREGLGKERDALLAEARRLRDELRTLQRAIRAPDVRTNEAALREKSRRVDEVIAEVVEQKATAARNAAGPAPAAEAIKAGQKVHVVSLGCDAEVLIPPDGRGRVQVRAGILTATVGIDDLRLGGGKVARLQVAPKPAPVRVGPAEPSWDALPPPTPDNSVDLRGLRVDEALEKAERFLDALLEREQAVAFLIHGHGTGALKREIRQWLKTSRYVREFRPAPEHQGGDGATVVLLS